MPTDDLEEAKAKIKKDMKTLKNLYGEMNDFFGEPKDSDKKEDKKFQLKILALQQGTDIVASVIAIIASLFVAIFAIQLTQFDKLSSLVPTWIFPSIIIVEIVMALVSIVGSWFIVLFLRNRKIKEIEAELDKKPTKPKPTEKT
jgi:uncharacterized integral membrane protein